MNELEFQRPLSPDQIREALSLLDSTGNAKLDPLDRIPDLQVLKLQRLIPALIRSTRRTLRRASFCARRAAAT